MEKINRILRTLILSVTSAMLSGCAVYAAMRAMSFEISWLPIYLSALAVACLMQLSGRNRIFSLCAALGCLAVGGILLAQNISVLSADLSQDTHEALFRAIALSCGLAIIAATLFSLMLKTPITIALALTAEIAVILCALAMNEELSLWIAVPGVAASVLAFALPAEVRGEMRPVLAVPAALLALLALAFVPSERVTWAPFENVAEKIRSVVQDYIRFTEERVAFSINELGYDHAGLIEDNVVAMLGGNAEPSEDSFMRVVTNRDVLLRGTIKRSYTGYSWVDDQAKARYLYYDFTHASVRDKVFDADRKTAEGVFLSVNAEIEILAEGTSTLFVPAQMLDFSMNLSNAVYYNSTGEVFLTRNVQARDRYSLTSRVPGSREGLIEYAESLVGASDARYNDAMLNYTHLPDGIDSKVYALAVNLTENCGNAAEKAYAIQDYLAENCTYTLNGGYPGAGEDFVSWFLLESKEGYCSYFASAMTVMCRMVGIPARYVEGYYVHPVDGEAIVTGKNAHAWVEVYLNGIGWIAFDPTAAAVGLDSDANGEAAPNENAQQGSENEQNPGSENAPDDEPDQDQNEPDDQNEDRNDDQNDNQNEDPVTPPESEDDLTPPESGDEAEDEPVDEPLPNAKGKHTWLWILLAMLLLAALIVLGVRYIKKRLAATDPLKLIRETKSALAAALILYRANLNLLARTGLAPTSGETPTAFARRVNAAIPNEAYAEFVNDVALSRYSGKPLAGKTVELGEQAYQAFLGGMSRMERLKYHLSRLLHGVGDTENIP